MKKRKKVGIENIDNYGLTSHTFDIFVYLLNKIAYFIRTVEEIDKTVEALAEAEREHELEAEPEPEEDEIEKAKPKKIPNQFNFCERAALTYDNPMRACILYFFMYQTFNLNFCLDIENK